jgi:hypothetical protein
MKLKPSLEKKSSLAIVIVVVALLIFFIALFLSPSFLENETAENMTLNELNETLTDKLDRIEERNSFTVTRREVDEDQKNVTLYEIYMNEDQIAELQGKEIGGWTITVLPDTDYMKEMDAARAEIMEMKKNPEFQISGSSMTAGNVKEIELWVYNRTPENEALEGKVIRGWTIHVYGPGYIPTEKE